MEYSGEMNPNSKHKPDPEHKPNLGVGLWVHILLFSGFDIVQFSQTFAEEAVESSLVPDLWIAGHISDFLSDLDRMKMIIRLQ